jgi:hypothetical protein
MIKYPQLSRSSDWLRPRPPGFSSRQGHEIYLYFTAFRPALGPIQLPINWVQEPLSPRIEQPGHEADHSPTSSAEFMNCGAIVPLPHMYSWSVA